VSELLLLATLTVTFVFALMNDQWIGQAVAMAATVRVFLRPRASVAALPSGHLEHCHPQLDALLPGQFGRAHSVLEADLANLNAILHPPAMVCNAGWIEATAGKFGFYAEGSGPAVTRVMDAIDRERPELARRLGVRAVSFAELSCQLGFTTGHDLHGTAAAGSPAPAITALTHLAGVINGIDDPRKGLTLERMGLAGKTPAEIRAYVGAPAAELAGAHASKA
jgi:opine dehydrogenase